MLHPRPPGSDPSRLRNLITQYYATQALGVQQSVDDKLCAFVWSLLATQDNVVIGLAPDGAEAVYFPPQMSASRKGKDKDEDNIGSSLVTLPRDEFTSTPLNNLLELYGTTLRIAVTPETCFKCVTGSHIRSPKLSGPVYAVLQLITRTRREGISVVDISKQSGYDPKTCFYLVQTLVNLGHIHKIKVGGAAGNICIHKNFYDDQCEWKKAEKEMAYDTKKGQGPRPASPAASEDEDENAGKEFSGTIQFDPIDNRHISNIAVIKSRLHRLLSHMPHGVHVYRNLLFGIGFDASTKRERRTFNHRIHELIKTRFIEKVWAPSATKFGARVLCVRLVQDNENTTPMDLAEPEAGDGDDPLETTSLVECNQVEFDSSLTGPLIELLARFEGTCATRSIAHQIISVVEKSGPTGATIADISGGMCSFDPRSITGLVARFAAGIPPTHLADRGLVIMTETAGRERRQRIYTRAGYHTMHQREGFQDDPTDKSAEILAGAGGWAVFEKEEFVDNEMARWQWTADTTKVALMENGEKLLKTRGKKKRTNPLDANGRPIIGRPRKEWKTNRDKDNTDISDLPKKRGRPPKRKLEEVGGEEDQKDKPVTKKRGRPPKAKGTTEAADRNQPESSSQVALGELRDESAGSHMQTEQGEMEAETEAVVTEPIDERPTAKEGVRASEDLPVDASSGKRTRRSRRHGPSDQSEAIVPLLGSPTKRASARLGNRVINLGIVPTPEPPAKRVRVDISSEADADHERVDPVDQAIPGPLSLEDLSRLDGVDTPPHTGGDNPYNTYSSWFLAPRMGRPANVSALRRQTEFMQVIERFDGVANISNSKSFNDEHQRILNQLHSEGKAVSTTPGTGMDRRTFNAAFSSLESRGLIKTRVVSTVVPAGTTRRATIAYFPNTAQHLIDECVQKFRESSTSAKGASIMSDFPVLPGAEIYSGPRPTTHTVNSLSVPPQTPPVPPDPLTMARYEQLSNPMTSAQYLGYIPGSLARAQALHLNLVSAATSETPPRHITTSNDWVISKAYFSDSLPVATYCSVIKLGFVGLGIRELLDSENGQRIRLHEAPVDIQAGLGVQSLGMKSRLFKSLSLLVDLGCLIPVKPRRADNSQKLDYVSEAREGVEWNYFKLAKSVPIYRFGDKDQSHFCYNHAIQDLATATSFWKQLRVASDRSKCLEIPTGDGSPYGGDSKIAKSVRRRASWESGYVLSSAQIEYLESLVDHTTGHTPLDDLESARFDNACFVTTAPAGVVSEYFTQKRAIIQGTVKRRLSEAQKEEIERRRMQDESRKALAAKAAKAKLDQESRWETIVSKALDGRAPSHTQLQKGLLTLKSEFILSPRSGSSKTWETKIREVVRDSIGAKQFVIPPRVPVQPFKPVEEPNNEVTTLIHRQGQPIVQKDISPKKSGRKSKREMEESEERNSEKTKRDSRRRRFPWDMEYDELARDAGAVIRVRCQGKRIDWSALEQVFPGVQRSCVRQRISSLEGLPGASIYYRKLDAAWASIYQRYLGSDELPDPNPDSLKDFDLPAYISFLRQHIDKAALRTGTETTKANSSESSFVPVDLEHIHANYIVNSSTLGQIHKRPTNWDFCFDVASEEPREREFLQHPFVVHEDSPDIHTSLNVSLAQASIKVTVLIPRFVQINETPEGSISIRICELRSAQWPQPLTCIHRELQRLKGDFSSSIYPDAAAVRDNLECLQAEEWMDIDLTDEDGEDPESSSSSPTLISPSDDENLEAHISLRLKHKSTSAAPPQNVSFSSQVSDVEQLLEPTLAVNHSNQITHSYSKEAPTDRTLREAVDNSGPYGLPLGEAVVSSSFPMDSPAALLALTRANPPHAYILGYDQARIVSAKYLSDWTIEASDGGEANQTESRLIFPRRWLDIYGNTLEDVWTMSARVVIGAFVYRPCMSETTLRKRLRCLFDRQELNDILIQLSLSGKVKRISQISLPIGMNRLEDEKSIYWSLSDSMNWF
ncbi:b-block binding subunit of TFIIIC domain-containing protein [Rhizoctonia solani AG-1 IA]|uniref:B-block binding subunit of TFIIIC domain-containing protein n=1 Tax=Thanatephorus cucumeris (strain AG1-IA) TaxID=983506 RepID=L8WP25_THACA|nr:b-block binding subunit of TFIIIC domain-containing protein [Rhizoctonia solani AG-1 IA]